jgi:valyl-tRNA synthetase
MMETRFDPARFEPYWAQVWSSRNLFQAEAPSNRKPFCILIPPPNVTGKLHLGHALQSTLQDLVTRYHRMKGFNALWLPGTDHAGIATQLMVEREIEAEGFRRVDLGREKFLERVWAWKERYHDNIRRQLQRMGASCDWSRERFTLDPGLSRAVREAFVRLYREGKVYRGEYIVNWSPGLDTAISDLEVEMREVEDSLWRIAYPVEGTEERVVVATTRPETMLGDAALAFHPDDERYRRFLGKFARIPVAGRRIPFIADSAVDPEFGTGLVKVTPYHDPADFEIAKRHGLSGIEVINRRAQMTAEAGPAFVGLDVLTAREKLLDQLREEGWLVGEERIRHAVGHCQRSGTRVQPLVSLQWFCDVSEMASRAREAAQTGALRFHPASWVKTWDHWLSEIRPWCISRQLWWGHQIPAWYDADGNCYVAATREEAEAVAGTRDLVQDPDVLDTWFSSALWPISTLGWPDDTIDFRTFYPTQLLITGFDILFFWVARMVMFGLHFTGKVPFSDVHLTGLVRDASGQKMSKTKGNVLDPEDLIADYGADALRFTLAVLDSPGRDIPLVPARMAGYRAFGNKIWNAARYVILKVTTEKLPVELDWGELRLAERWILARLASALKAVDQHFSEYRFDLACQEIYQFFWSDFCDVYVELSKIGFRDPSRQPWVARTLLFVLDAALRLLHPVMPFLTEEVWQRLPRLPGSDQEFLSLSCWPEVQSEHWLNESERYHSDLLLGLCEWVRNVRAESALAPKSPAHIFFASEDPSSQEASFLLTPEASNWLRALAGVVTIEQLPSGQVPPGIQTARAGLLLGVSFPGAATDVRRDRVASELKEVEALLARARERLSNPQFLARAPSSVIEGTRKQVAELEARGDHLRKLLAHVAS